MISFAASLGCTLDFVSLYCPGSSTIQVESAFYGRYAATCNATCCLPSESDCVESVEEGAPGDWSLLVEECNDKSFCQFKNPGRALASCVEGEATSSDYLLVTHTCFEGEYTYDALYTLT